MAASANSPVFLSYSREDKQTARAIADALRAQGVEVWFDLDDLGGGDAWDVKIRRQIKECALFVPLISATTQARSEGYFRYEWHLAEQRSFLFAKGRAFILPVSIDGTRELDAIVPEAFLAVHWTPCADPGQIEAFARRVRAVLTEEVKVAPTASPFPGRGASARTSAAVPEKSVAVLAFACLNRDAENESFSDGITEELLNVLAKVPGLKVAARTSAFYFKHKKLQIQDIAQKLGVAYIVEGSVRRMGKRLRISVQLVGAADGFRVWGDSFDRDLTDIFAVQDEIAGVIADKLQLQLGASSRQERPLNLEAHRLVLEARYFRYQLMATDDAYARAEAAAVKAIELDPMFAEAHAALAEVCIIRVNYRLWRGLSNNEDDVRRTHVEAGRAIELNPALAEPHAALGYALLLEGKFAESETHLRKALSLNPNSAITMAWHALLQSCQGRLDVALDEIRKARALDPLRFISLQMCVRELVNAQLFEEALEVNTQVANLSTDVPILNAADQTLICHALGRTAEAVAAARFIMSRPALGPRWLADKDAVWVMCQSGFQAEAADYAAKIFAAWPADLFLRGYVLGALGRFDEALPYLERTTVLSVQWLFWDTMWDPYRDDPRFHAVITKLGFTSEYQTARESFAQIQRARGRLA